ncbi:RDD family protein [Marmoricola sp. RAF53]|uniref:RDD family protein n=1 Tax=Marmoricola sp. RAF53 TaxID=3233059 RepID=UPI003F97BDD5
MADLYAEGIDELVTGEAVTLDLPPASLPLHVASGMIDVVVGALVMIGGFVATAALAPDEALFSVGAILTLVTGMLVVPTVVETASRGRSLGKLVTGLRTVRDDAGPISFHHSFIRSLIGVVEIWMLTGVPAFFSALISSKGKRIGDYAAGTYVVRSRVTLSLAPPPPMPPQLAGWAAAADIAPLPERLLLAVRQVLGRADGLAPATRASLLQRLADQVSVYVAPPPPHGTPADAYLAAVIAEHRERDLARMRREAVMIDRLTAAGRTQRPF